MAYDSLATDFMAGKCSLVIKQCTSLLKKLDDSDTWKRSVLLNNRALCYLKMGIYRRSIKDAKAAIEIDPFWLRSQYTHIQALVKMKKFEEAKQVYKAWKKSANTVDLSLQREIEEYLKIEKKAAIEFEEAEKKRKIEEKAAKKRKKLEEKRKAQEKKDKEELEKKTAREKHEKSKFAFTAILKKTGQYKKAISEYTLLIQENPDLVRAYVERGELYLGLRKYSKAVKDLQIACKKDRNNFNALVKLSEARTLRAERYVARGPSYASEAPPMLQQAISEISRAVKIIRPTGEYNNLFSALRQRALIFRRQGNHEYALSDFQDALKIMPYHIETMIGMGLSLTDLGRSTDALKIYKEALTHNSKENLGLLHHYLAVNYHTLGEHEKAEESFGISIREGHMASKAVRGMYRYMQGHIQKCIEDMNSVGDLEKKTADESQMHFQMRGVAYHSLGQYRYAQKDYAQLLSLDPQMPTLVIWYRRQFLPVLQSVLDTPFTEYNYDHKLHPALKTGCAQSEHPTKVNKSYKPNNGNISESISDVNLSRSLSPQQQKIQDGTERLGFLLQCPLPGFLKNIRQHRMFGLAVLEIAQTVKKHWKKPIQVSGKGASMDRNPHVFGWRDMMDIAVRWRQHSEPNDHTFWIHLMENDDCQNGMQAALLGGQKKHEKFYTYRDRCFEMMKPLVCDQQKNLSAYDKKLIHEAKTEDDLFKLIGHDFWVIASCKSHIGNEDLESLRFILQNNEPDGYNFATQIPIKPERDEQFDKELTQVFNDLQKHVEGKREDNDLEKSLELCLTFYYYWVNYGNVTRGTGACGLIALDALLIATGYFLVEPVRELQIDWEASLASSHKVFLKNIRNKMNVKPLSEDTEGTPLKNLPMVSEHVTTLREMIHILNPKEY